MSRLRILLIEDDALDVELILGTLHRDGFDDCEVVQAVTQQQLGRALESDVPFHLVLSDYHLPEFDGLAALKWVRERWPEVPFLFVSGAIGEERAIATLKHGATDYVLKDRLDRLPTAARRALLEAGEREHRRRAEEALRRSEEQLRQLNERLEQQVAERTAYLQNILETAADAILTIDARGQIETVNPAAERMFGYSTSELIGQSVSLILPPPSDGEPAGVLMRRLLQSHDEGDSRELQGRRKDGGLFPVELALNEIGRLHRFTGILRDITRRKELEKEVLEVATQEQQRISQELHDGVGQELTGLSLLASALLDRMRDGCAAEPLVAELREGLARVHQQVRSLCHGLMLVELDSEGLRVALEELADRTSVQAGIMCILDCPEAVGVPDPFVATHLYRITQEAISNALRHGDARHIRISLYADQEFLHLEIEDDGVGISSSSDEGREAGESKGIGLATMRYRAGMINGSLEIRPADGGGTLVGCKLPLQSPQSVEA